MHVRSPNAARLGAFWFGIQVVWGALLGVSLQARTIQLQPHDAIAAYSLLAACGAAIAGVTQIVIGIVSDRRRRAGSRRLEFYGAGSVLAVAALFWFYNAPAYWQLFAALAVLQVAMNVATGPYQAAIPDFLNDRAVLGAAAWMAALQSLGNATGAVFAAEVRNGTALACAISVALVVSCVFTALHVRELPLRNIPHEPLRISRPFVDLFISRALVWLGFYTLLGYLYFLVASVTRGNATFFTGITVLVVTIAGAIGAAVAARARSADARLIASAGGGMFALALVLLLAFATSWTAIALIAALAGIAWGVFLAADWSLGCRVLPQHMVATSMGIWNLAVIGPQSIAPALAGAVLAALNFSHGSLASRAAFGLAVVETACGLIWLWRLPACVSVNTESSGNNA